MLLQSMPLSQLHEPCAILVRSSEPSPQPQCCVYAQHAKPPPAHACSVVLLLTSGSSSH